MVKTCLKNHYKQNNQIVHSETFKWTKRKDVNSSNVTQNMPILFVSLHDFEIMVMMKDKSVDKTLEWFVNLNMDKTNPLVEDLYEYAFLNKNKTHWNVIYEELTHRFTSKKTIKIEGLYHTIKHFVDEDGSFGKWKFVNLF